MAQSNSRSKRLFLEQLEDRLCLSPADPAIVFTFDQSVNRTLVSNLVVMNADGSNQTTILSSSTRHFRTPAWSPDLDGNPLNGYQGTLAVSTYTGNLNGDDQIWLVDVSVVNGIPQASNVRTLVDINDPAIYNGYTRIARDPVWSPDLDPITPGYQGEIAFMTTTSINVIDVAWNGSTVNAVSGPDTSRVLYAVPNTLTDSVGWPTWSNDGTKVAFALQSPIPNNNLAASLEMIDRDGSNLTTVIPLGYSLFPDWISDLDWSKTPGSTRVAFIGSQNAYGGVPNNLYTVDVNVGVSSIQKIPAATYSTRSPSWSPDDSATPLNETDKFIIFAGQDIIQSGKKTQVTTSTIRRVELATGIQTILAGNANANLLWPDWRPFPSAGWAPATVLSTTAPSLTASAIRFASVNNSSILAPAQANGDWSAYVTITGGQQEHSGFATPSKLPTAAGKSTETVLPSSQISWHRQSEPLFHFRSLKAISLDALDEFWSGSGAGVLHAAVKEDLALPGIA